ncbi:helix-turn-helix transcriptional regulator [Acinetobacter sp. Tr-809]|uniref:helix-turn-helix domain-containing protein n=1 Tax=Acinetobacter sp. Tr-809 TaxID=2608324 RepID=UPI00141E99AC|nr:AraC family transcriptional regulator [Acinetobacter sp. Tr-809]NIE98229.1 helix-turn-helix transcriptional regulator [Acinetobacter sp. Tr-809]
MFHNFLHYGDNIKLHVIEAGNKDIKSVAVFFLFDVDSFFSVFNRVPFNNIRCFFIYKCEVFKKNCSIDDFLSEISSFFYKLDVTNIHIVFKRDLSDFFRECLYSLFLFDTVTVCNNSKGFCFNTFFSLFLCGSKDEESFIDKVNFQIANVLAEGEPYLFKVAKEMKIKPRILSIKIKNEGGDFKALVKQKRYEKALTLLKDQDVCLSDIAYKLGYTEYSAFTRAFRGWAGCSPSKLRKYLNEK